MPAFSPCRHGIGWEVRSQRSIGRLERVGGDWRVAASVWGWKGLRDRLIPPPARDRAPAARPVCPKLHPAWARAPPGMGHPQPLWAACSCCLTTLTQSHAKSKQPGPASAPKDQMGNKQQYLPQELSPKMKSPLCQLVESQVRLSSVKQFLQAVGRGEDSN